MYPVETFVIHNKTPTVYMCISKLHWPVILHNGEDGDDWETSWRGTLGLHSLFKNMKIQNNYFTKYFSGV